jgi:hypothetical protein
MKQVLQFSNYLHINLNPIRPNLIFSPHLYMFLCFKKFTFTVQMFFLTNLLMSADDGLLLSKLVVYIQKKSKILFNVSL